MSLIDLDTARAHLRLESDYPAGQIEPYLFAAESAAAQFLNRRVFADQAALDTAIAAVPAALVAAGAAYEAACAAADEIEDSIASCAARDHACRAYRAARTLARETYDGMPINPQIQAAMLLTLGHLFENRQDNVTGTIVSPLQVGVEQLLFPYRVGLGV